MPAQVRADPALLVGVDEEPLPVEPGPDAKTLEAEQGAAEIVAADPIDGECAVRDGGQPDEAPDLDVVGADRVGGAVERLPPSMT